VLRASGDEEIAGYGHGSCKNAMPHDDIFRVLAPPVLSAGQSIPGRRAQRAPFARSDRRLFEN
jgi:hypothetical protein